VRNHTNGQLRHRLTWTVAALFTATILPLTATPIGAASPFIAVPLAVDATALATPTSGPVVAIGSLLDANGRPAQGTVAVLAWPNEASSSKSTVGAAIATPTVGWATARSDGSFTIRVDRSKISSDYINADGRVNLMAIGWTASGQGSWSFPVDLSSATIATQAGTMAATPTTSFQLVANKPLAMAPVHSKPAGTSSGVIPDIGGPPPCYYRQVGTYYAWVEIGRGWPYGADTSRMEVESTHSMTVGVAASVTGLYGSWSASGTSSITNGDGKKWTDSVAYRDYQLEHRYGENRLWCTTYWANDYRAVDQGRAGYTQNGSAGTQPAWYFCGPNAPGDFTRSSTSGNHFSTSVGVGIAGSLGINLSVDSNYGTDQKLIYSTTVNGTICGNNDDAGFASLVKTSR